MDNQGNLYITGRKQEIIIRSGENISPKEIEDHIMRFPSTFQTKVFGIPAEVVQEEIAACVISSDKNFSIRNLREHLKKHLADYKIPKYIYVFNSDGFPLNSNGKINIMRLKEETQLRISREENR